MKFHITITNNETGEELLNCDACAIIGAVGTDDGVHQICMTACTGDQLAQTLICANKAIEGSYKDANPAVRAFIELLQKMKGELK